MCRLLSVLCGEGFLCGKDNVRVAVRIQTSIKEGNPPIMEIAGNAYRVCRLESGVSQEPAVWIRPPLNYLQ